MRPDDASSRRVLQVGHARPFSVPSEAARIARDGDVIEIAPALYEGDDAIWPQNDLTMGPGFAARESASPCAAAICTTTTPGCSLQKGVRAENGTLIVFGAEGLSGPTDALYVINNTMVNDRARWRWARTTFTPPSQAWWTARASTTTSGRGRPLSGRGPIREA